jgi:ribosomal protein L37AE/L43A
MGEILRPICTCNHKFEPLYVEFGIYNQHTFHVPFVCSTCGTITSEDIHVENHLCEKCNKSLTMLGEIDGPELIPGIDFYDYRMYLNPQAVRNHISDKRRNYRLECKKYTCPCCKTENLEFDYGGIWD